MKRIICALLTISLISSLSMPIFAQNSNDSLFIDTELEQWEMTSFELDNNGNLVSFEFKTERDGTTIIYSSEPPPGMESSAIQARGYEDDCGHYVPAGYTRLGYYSGNTTFDMIASGSLVTLSTFVFSFVSMTASLFVSLVVPALAAGASESIISGDYTVTSYDCIDPGIYPYIYWHHTACYIDYDSDDIEEYICTAGYEYAQLPQ